VAIFKDKDSRSSCARPVPHVECPSQCEAILHGFAPHCASIAGHTGKVFGHPISKSHVGLPCLFFSADSTMPLTVGCRSRGGTRWLLRPCPSRVSCLADLKGRLFLACVRVAIRWQLFNRPASTPAGHRSGRRTHQPKRFRRSLAIETV
jgi:hypothetical protein